MKPLHQYVSHEPENMNIQHESHVNFSGHPGENWSQCYENYNYNEPTAAYDNHHWGNNSANNEGWGHSKNPRYHRDHRQQATRHPYHRDPRPPPAHRGADRGRHSHRGGAAGGAVHNARRYLEQRRLQERKRSEAPTRADNWGNETATAREREIAEEEERKNKEAKSKVRV